MRMWAKVGVIVDLATNFSSGCMGELHIAVPDNGLGRRDGGRGGEKELPSKPHSLAVMELLGPCRKTKNSPAPLRAAPASARHPDYPFAAVQATPLSLTPPYTPSQGWVSAAC